MEVGQLNQMNHFNTPAHRASTAATTNTHILMYAHTYTHVRTHVYIHMPLNFLAYFIQPKLVTHIHTHTHTHTHTCTHTHARTYTRTHTRTHARTHARTRTPTPCGKYRSAAALMHYTRTCSAYYTNDRSRTNRCIHSSRSD